MKDGQPYSEFAQYPEITGPQQYILCALGLALFGVQGTEAKLKFLLSFVFPHQEDATLTDLYERDKKASKATLGMLITKLRERADVTREFEGMLQSFLDHRNRFIHGLLMEKGFNIGMDEGVQNVRKFIDQLEFECWHIDAILVGYIVAFTKAIAIADETIPKDSIYFQNLPKYFSPEIDWKQKHAESGTHRPASLVRRSFSAGHSTR